MGENLPSGTISGADSPLLPIRFGRGFVQERGEPACAALGRRVNLYAGCYQRPRPKKPSSASTRTMIVRMIQSKLMNVSLREVDTDTTARSPNWLRRTFGWRTWAERPLAHSSAVGQSGTVQVAPDLLRRADRADTLPRLGGMARPNGVVIVSERHWAFARVDGELFEGEMPERRQRAARIPLVRGLLRLAASMTPLVRGQGVAGRRERSLLLLAVGAPLLFWLLPATVGLVAGIVVLGRPRRLGDARPDAAAPRCRTSRDRGGRAASTGGGLGRHRAAEPILAAVRHELRRVGAPGHVPPRHGLAVLTGPVGARGRGRPVAGADDGALAGRAGPGRPHPAAAARSRPGTAASDDPRARARGARGSPSRRSSRCSDAISTASTPRAGTPPHPRRSSRRARSGSSPRGRCPRRTRASS